MAYSGNPNDYLPFDAWVDTQPEANRDYLRQQGEGFARQFGFRGPSDPDAPAAQPARPAQPAQPGAGFVPTTGTIPPDQGTVVGTRPSGGFVNQPVPGGVQPAQPAQPAQPGPQGQTNPNDYLPFDAWVNTQPEANRAYLRQQGEGFARQFGFRGPGAPGAPGASAGATGSTGAPATGTPGAAQPGQATTNINVSGGLPPVQTLPGGLGVPTGLTADMLRALVAQMTSAAAGAADRSAATGIVHEPVFDPATGRWNYQPVNGPNGQPLSTVASQLTRAQIEEMAARSALARQVAAGRVQDPQTGQWIATPAALAQQAQTALANAQSGYTEAQRAYLAGAQTELTRAQAGQIQAGITGYSAAGQATLERQRVEADIAATRDRLRIAEQQGNADLALRERQRLDSLQIEQSRLAQTQAGITGFTASGQATLERQRVEADITATRDRLRIAEQQGNADLALRERQRLDSLQIEQSRLAQRQTEITGFTASGQATLERQRVDADITATRDRLRIAEQQGNADLALRERQRLDSLQTEQSRLAQAESQFGRELALRTGQATGVVGGQQTLEAQRFAFEQAQAQAQLAANPRNYIEASFLRDARGGLPTFAGALAQDRSRANGVLLSPTDRLGTPGAADHLATEERPDGTRVNYFGNVVQTPQGIANVPVGAFSRALLEGRRTSGAGALPVSGGYADAGALRSAFDINRTRLADYLRGNPSEQAQFRGLSSFAGGLSDEDTARRLRSFAPRTGSVAGGATVLG